MLHIAIAPLKNQISYMNIYQHISCIVYIDLYICTSTLGALRALTSSWRQFGPLDFVHRALWALRLCDPIVGDWMVC